MAKLPGSDVKMIKLNPEWSVEKASTTPLEKEVTVNCLSGKRLVITLPGAGGFCNKELDLIKDNMDKLKEAGADEVIVVVGTDILTNAGHGLPNLLQDVEMKFAEANNLKLDGVQSRYLNRAVIAVNPDGEEVAREDSPLLACRTLDTLLKIAEKGFLN